MADYIRSNIGSGYNTATSINTELGKIETAIASKVDEAGGVMTGDLQMNSNDILNAGQVTASTIVLNGVALTADNPVNSDTTVTTTRIVATAGQTVFTVPSYSLGINAIQVFLNGVKLSVATDYAETNTTTVTLTDGASEDDVFEALIGSTVTDANNYDSALVTYTQGGTGSVATNVREKLQETVSVKDFGAVGDGVTDDTAAIQAALAYNECVYFPEGNYAVSGELSLRSRHHLHGNGKVDTTITYNGVGRLFVNNTGSRVFDVTIRDLYINNAGTGTDCFYLEDFVKGHFERVEVNNFDRAFVLETTNAPSSNSLYNRWINCTANSCGTGWHFVRPSGGSSSSSANSNTIAFCRTNVCTNGIIIDNANDVTVTGCQLEAGTNGVTITDDTGGVSNRNRVMHCRFENNSGTHITIGSNVAETVLLANYYVGTGTRLSDSGVRTQDMDMFGVDWQFRLTSPYSTPEGSFQFSRTTSAPSSEPMAVFDDQNTGSGTPVTVDIKTGRALGKPLRIRDTSSDVFLINGQGHIETNQTSSNANTPSGATSAQMPIYDETGSLVGYIPVYGSPW